MTIAASKCIFCGAGIGVLQGEVNFRRIVCSACWLVTLAGHGQGLAATGKNTLPQAPSLAQGPSILAA